MPLVKDSFVTTDNKCAPILETPPIGEKLQSTLKILYHARETLVRVNRRLNGCGENADPPSPRNLDEAVSSVLDLAGNLDYIADSLADITGC